MAYETWGTFSVRDHLALNAFVVDVLMYDRLVIPVPMKGDEPRWRKQGWNPEAQDVFLQTLGRLARPVRWDANLEAKWQSRMTATNAIRDLAVINHSWGSMLTRSILTEDLPASVQGIQSVSAYSSVDDITADLKIRPVTAADAQDIQAYQNANKFKYPETALYAIMGHQLFTPADDGRPAHELLIEAVEMAESKEFRRKRASFYRWQREFLRDGYGDADTLQESIDEMNDLVNDYKNALSKAKWKKKLTNIFTVAPLAVTAIFAPNTTTGAAVTLSTAFFTVARLATASLLPELQISEPPPAAMVYDVRKGFGWK